MKKNSVSLASIIYFIILLIVIILTMHMQAQTSLNPNVKRSESLRNEKDDPDKTLFFDASF